MGFVLEKIIQKTQTTMRRATNVYIIVMSLFFLRVKCDRSPLTECYQRIDAAHDQMNGSLISDSLLDKSYSKDQCLISEIAHETDRKELPISIMYSENMLKNAKNYMHVEHSNIDIKRHITQEPFVDNLRRRTRFSTVLPRINTDSKNVIQRETRHMQRLQTREARRVSPGREVVQRWSEVNPKKEIRLQRSARLNEIFSPTKHRVDFRLERRLTKQGQPRERINGHSYDPDDRRGQTYQKRFELVEKVHKTRRCDQRNFASVRTFERSFIGRETQRRESRRHTGESRENEMRVYREVQNRRDRHSERRTKNSGLQNFRRKASDNRKRIESRNERRTNSRGRETQYIIPRSNRRSLSNAVIQERRRTDDILKNEMYGSRQQSADVVKGFPVISEFSKVNEVRQRRTERRETGRIGTKEIQNRRQDRVQERQRRDFRDTRDGDFRRNSHRKTSVINLWNWGESGLSRAVVLGVAGILGGRLWQKQV